VRAHLRTLGAAAPDVVPAYVAMARRTAERAHASGQLSAEQFASLQEALR
jgi:hypothetical protein